MHEKESHLVEFKYIINGSDTAWFLRDVNNNYPNSTAVYHIRPDYSHRYQWH
jgi:hypothetical protein